MTTTPETLALILIVAAGTHAQAAFEGQSIEVLRRRSCNNHGWPMYDLFMNGKRDFLVFNDLDEVEKVIQEHFPSYQPGSTVWLRIASPRCFSS